MTDTCKRCGGAVQTERQETKPDGLGGYVTLTHWIEPICENCHKIPITVVRFADCTRPILSDEQGRENDRRVMEQAPWLEYRT